MHFDFKIRNRIHKMNGNFFKKRINFLFLSTQRAIIIELPHDLEFLKTITEVLEFHRWKRESIKLTNRNFSKITFALRIV